MKDRKPKIKKIWDSKMGRMIWGVVPVEPTGFAYTITRSENTRNWLAYAWCFERNCNPLMELKSEKLSWFP